MYILGAFGRIYKGTWTHKTVDSGEVSQIVAIKTIKSKTLFIVHSLKL